MAHLPTCYEELVERVNSCLVSMLNSDIIPRFELKYEDDLNGFITVSSNLDYRNAIANATLLNLNKLILHVRIQDEEDFS